METSRSTTSRQNVFRFLAVSVAIGILLWAGPGVPVVGAEQLTILHTNDMHSHLLGFPEADYPPTGTGEGALGGLARVATVVKQIREDRELQDIPGLAGTIGQSGWLKVLVRIFLLPVIGFAKIMLWIF